MRPHADPDLFELLLVRVNTPQSWAASSARGQAATLGNGLTWTDEGTDVPTRQAGLTRNHRNNGSTICCVEGVNIAACTKRKWTSKNLYPDPHDLIDGPIVPGNNFLSFLLDLHRDLDEARCGSATATREIMVTSPPSVAASATSPPLPR